MLRWVSHWFDEGGHWPFSVPRLKVPHGFTDDQPERPDTGGVVVVKAHWCPSVLALDDGGWSGQGQEFVARVYFPFPSGTNNERFILALCQHPFDNRCPRAEDFPHQSVMPLVAAELHSRPPFERMMRIHESLKAGRYPNCSQLARAIEVSTRTIKRDVDFMKYRLDLPIEYDPQRYGYYYAQPVEKFPSVPVTEAEVFALLVAHKAIAQYHGTPFEQPLQVAFRKLTGQLNDRHALSLGNLEQALSFHPFAPDEADLETFQILSRALQEQRAVQFSYKNLGADKAQIRRVHPYHLACVENRWYLVAHDPARGAMRNFAMTRMRRVGLLEERCTLPKGFQIEDYLKGSFGIFQAGDDFEVVVDFDNWAGELVRERKWHRSQQLTDLPGGGVRLHLRLNNLAEVERWILSWGTHATVVRPERLREAVQRIGTELASRYAR